MDQYNTIGYSLGYSPFLLCTRHVLISGKRISMPASLVIEYIHPFTSIGKHRYED